MPLTNGLVDTEFASRHRLQPSPDITHTHNKQQLKQNQRDNFEENVFFNDALNTFYLRLYGVGHMVKDHLDSDRGNPLSPHGIVFPISSKGTFICTIRQTG